MILEEWPRSKFENELRVLSPKKWSEESLIYVKNNVYDGINENE